MKSRSFAAIHRGFKALACAVVLVASGLGLVSTTALAQPSRTYTTNADFDVGVKFNVDHAPVTSVNNALELTAVRTTFPVLWIANAAEDTVSKINTDTGTEVARYRTWFGPSGQPGFQPHENNFLAGAAPSRTAVDIDGNAYVLNRHFDGRRAMLAKILNTGGIDRNGNGTIQTSTGPADVKPLADSAPANGQIDVAELQDERVAWVSYVGDGNGIGRALCIGPDGHLWVGLFNSQQYYKVSSVDGSILLGPISVPWTPYGCLIDSAGTLWSASISSTLGKITNTHLNAGQVVSAIDHSGVCFQNYGIALSASRVNLACVSGGGYITCDKATGICTLPVTSPPVQATGIAVDANGDIWLSQYLGGGVFKHRGSDNAVLCSNAAGAGFEHRGVIIDSRNDAWQVGVSDDIIARFRGTDCAAMNQIAVGDGPYTYSDASGLGAIIERGTGTWTVIQDAGASGANWGTISWNAALPPGTSVTVRAQASNNAADLAGPPSTPMTNGAVFTAVGRFIKVEARLTANPSQQSPQLLDISIAARADPVKLSGTLTVTPKPVPQGAAVTIVEAVRNIGTATVTGVPIRLVVINPAGQVVADWSDTPTIAVGATFQVARNFTPIGAVGAVFKVELSARINGVVTPLASDSFTITERPVMLNVTLDRLRQGRVLALVSCAKDMRGRDHDHDDDRHDDRDRHGHGKDHDEKDHDKRWQHQNSRKCAAERAKYLDAYLGRLGVTRLVTTSDDEFRHALRSGRHNVYWLAGGRTKLHDDLDEELREAIFRGESLIVDGVQDERNKDLDPVLGVRFRGKLGRDDQGVNVTGPVLPPGTLTTVGRALRLELTTGQARGVFPASRNSPAIVLNQYGLGRTELFAFDLVGTLMAHKPGADDALIQAGLAWLLPPLPAVMSPLEYIVLRTRVANAGPAVDLRVRLDAPAGSTVVSTAPAAVPDANGRPVWSFNLPANATTDLLAGLVLPAASGNAVARATVQSVRNSIVTTYGTFDITLPIEGVSVIGPRVLSGLKALKVASKDRRHRDRAVSSVEAALAKLAAGRHGSAIEELLEAADELREISSVDVSGLRVQIGRMLKEAQLRWAKAH